MRILPPKIENNLRVGVIFYCKDCEKVVSVTPVGRKFVYRCNICKTKNVAFGSEKSIKNFFHIKDEPVTESPAGANIAAPVAVSATQAPGQPPKERETVTPSSAPIPEGK